MTTGSELAVISKNVANIHKEPDRRSEMISQAALGHPVLIEQRKSNWALIQTQDGYQGWVDSRWIVEKDDREHETAKAAVVASLFADILISPDHSAEIITKAVTSTRLNVENASTGWMRTALPDGAKGFIASEHITTVNDAQDGWSAGLIEFALRFIGVPYLWGGTTPFGIDCSGFTQLVFRSQGVILPRDAWMQAKSRRGHTIETVDLQPGDLLFFAGGSDRDKITHAALSTGGLDFIHSSVGVGVNRSSLNEPRYSEIFTGARRVM